MKKLQETPEYKELRKKQEKEIQELKKKKGISLITTLSYLKANFDYEQ